MTKRDKDTERSPVVIEVVYVIDGEFIEIECVIAKPPCRHPMDQRVSGKGKTWECMKCDAVLPA